MRVKITFSIITTNHLADGKGFYVGGRLFMKNKKIVSKGGLELMRVSTLAQKPNHCAHLSR